MRGRRRREGARAARRAAASSWSRDRVERLCDPGPPFLELSPLAAEGLYDGDAPGRRDRHRRRARARPRSVVVVANDATVKGGTYYPMTVKKHLRAQEIALQNRLPCVYLVDSGGAFLPLQDEVFPDREHFGRIFFNQAQLSQARDRRRSRRDGLVHRRRRLRAGDERRDRDRRASRARSSSAARRW